MQATRATGETLSEVRLAPAKATCGDCLGDGIVWTRRDGRNVETCCGTCAGEGEL
jgi:DnaJ-class molecular chaperone